MLSLLGFLLILAPLVVVHELGHFFFARLFGVRAEVFSVGFGPRIFSRKKGETEWRVSAIPLGGYVKLLGEDPSTPLSAEDRKRSLHAQAPWKRFWIFFGGPLFNFLFAILVFAAILLIGEPQLSNRIGRVIEGSDAAKAGLVSGDHILSIDGNPTPKFSDVITVLHERPGTTVHAEIGRNGGRTKLDIQVLEEDGFSVYGESRKVGKLDGLMPVSLSNQMFVTNPKSAASLAGLRSADRVTHVEGTLVADFEELSARYREHRAGPVKFAVVRGGKDLAVTLAKPERSMGLSKDLGIYSSELIVEKPMPGSAAEKAGVKPGDRVTRIGKVEVTSFFGLREAIQGEAQKGGDLEIAWERDGQPMSAKVTPKATKERDPLLNRITQFTIGVVPVMDTVEPETLVERVWNPVTLLVRATERMAVFSWRNFVSIWKMITGDVSVATLGGPILIGKIAGDSLERGLIAFLTTMAILSVGLGVLNVLPVPVLDGGHLLLLGIETIRRKPLSMRQIEVVQQVGLSLILLLMVIVIRNDLARLPIFN